MQREIDAIFLDVGNTLRVVVKDEPFQAAARKQLMELAGTPDPEDIFFKRLVRNWKAYREWSLGNMAEATESELWTRFLLPDYPAETITPLALELTRLWRETEGRRIPRLNARETVNELYHRGYTLGIIANMITSNEVPDWLKSEGLADYFRTVVVSTVFGKRKPDPGIFYEALRQAHVDPTRSAYIGDNPERDVVGSRKAGFGLVIILLDQEKP